MRISDSCGQNVVELDGLQDRGIEFAGINVVFVSRKRFVLEISFNLYDGYHDSHTFGTGMLRHELKC